MLTLWIGPARCGKTERLLGLYRAALTQHPLGGALWLAPTWRAASEVRQRLFEKPQSQSGDSQKRNMPPPDHPYPGCFAPNIMTFGKFAEAVLRAAQQSIRPMTRWMKRELIRQIINEHLLQGRLKYFRSIALTEGLVDLVCEFISELKRLEVWPDQFQKACATRGLGDKDAELYEIYEAYQQELREHGLFDAEGRFWSARDELQKANDCSLQKKENELGQSFVFQTSLLHRRFQLVVVDGFTDFTRTEHEIIELLAGRAEQAIITLPLESETHRTDLFTKPLKTLAELERRHPRMVVEKMARPIKTAWPAAAHLEQTLFMNPRERENARVADRAPPTDGIEILAAARQMGEIEWIGGRIKRLLADGQVRPDEIVVVFRLAQEADGPVGEVFDRLGIPAVFESGPALISSPLLRFLVALLQLQLDDWPFGSLLAVLGNNYFRPRWTEWRGGDAAAEVELNIRKLQIPRGRDRLHRQLAGAENRTANKDSKSANDKNPTLLIIQRLAEAFDAMPERATLPGWAKEWQRLADEIGLLRAMDSNSGQAPLFQQAAKVSDRRAWDRLMEVLNAGDRLASWLQRRPPELDRRSAFDSLLSILHTERVGHSGDESGCVRILSASSVRSLRIPHLFMAGLSEKVFPPPDREDRLYSEAEYARLIEAGLPLVARSERTREEMLLFYEAATRATQRLYLSYPALDETAQPLLPSPFLQEIEQAFLPARLTRIERADLSPIPADDEPLCTSEFRVKALATALEGNVALLAGLMQGEAIDERNFAAGLEIIHSRQDRDRFGPAEGVLESLAARDWLAVRYSSEHVFAATELERYASCPYRFFLERLLKIEPLEDLALEFDVMTRGRVVHDVLASFHRRVNERFGRPASPLELDAAEFEAMMNASIAESLPAEPDNSVAAALREVDRRLVVQWLSDYRRQCESYDHLWSGFDVPMAPELFEASFGQKKDETESTHPPLEFVADDQVVRLSGRIDRIDVGTVAGRSVFNVLDYKTGAPIRLDRESILSGTALQIPVYAFAAMELFLVARNPYPWQGGYWYVRDKGFQPRRALQMYRNDSGRIELEPLWEELRSSLADTLAMLVRAIRRGRFPVCSDDEYCTGRCPYNTICRINQVRSLEKTCQPTASK